MTFVLRLGCFGVGWGLRRCSWFENESGVK